jgi:hypothetical protein
MITGTYRGVPIKGQDEWKKSKILNPSAGPVKIVFWTTGLFYFWRQFDLVFENIVFSPAKISQGACVGPFFSKSVL